MSCRLSVVVMITAISFTGLSAGDFVHPAPSASLVAGAAAGRMEVQNHSQQSSRPADSCLNVFAEGVAALGFVEVAPGVFTLAGLPTPTTIGGIDGELSSVVTSLETSGSAGQGAQHLTLQHRFVSTDPAGSFTTEDRAVCAPAGTDANVCHVNDALQIVSGDGVFANASGSLHNHAIADLNTNTLTFSLRGRVCADGL
jgi:hypothetical protein